MNAKVPAKPPKKVLLMLRSEKQRRHLVNEQLFINIIESYNLSYTIMRGSGSFKEQFDLMSTHGVFVSPHGAGLTNTILMPPQSAVIELFPYHIDHNLYATMATLMGIASYPVHSINGSIPWASNQVSLLLFEYCSCGRDRGCYPIVTTAIAVTVAAAAADYCCCCVVRLLMSVLLRAQLRRHVQHGGQHAVWAVSHTRDRAPVCHRAARL
jgi:hypothetical protein